MSVVLFFALLSVVIGLALAFQGGGSPDSPYHGSGVLGAWLWRASLVVAGAVLVALLITEAFK